MQRTSALAQRFRRLANKKRTETVTAPVEILPMEHTCEFEEFLYTILFEHAQVKEFVRTWYCNLSLWQLGMYERIALHSLLAPVGKLGLMSIAKHASRDAAPGLKGIACFHVLASDLSPI